MIDYNTILNRNNTCNKIKEELILFEKEKYNISQKRGFYIYGDSGIGKTKFVEKILENNEYFLIKFNAGDVRNKNIIDNILEGLSRNITFEINLNKVYKLLLSPKV